jgi:hypothetical protein
MITTFFRFAGFLVAIIAPFFLECLRVKSIDRPILAAGKGLQAGRRRVLCSMAEQPADDFGLPPVSSTV